MHVWRLTTDHRRVVGEVRKQQKNQYASPLRQLSNAREAGSERRIHTLGIISRV